MENSTMTRREMLAAAATVAVMRPERVLGANDRIRVAMFGAGRRGLLGEALQFAKDSNVDIAVVCDTWRQRREAASARIQKTLGTTPELAVHYEDVLARKDIDAVIIGTPDHQHCTQLAAAARAGKDAYVEKPMAMNMKELIMAVDAVKKYKRVVQVGTQIRSLPASVAARKFVAGGGLGKILKVEQSRNGWKPYWHGYADPNLKESDVDWKAFLMHVKPRPFDADQYTAWMGYREFSQGSHAGLMVHFIDLMHFITGAKAPRRVMAMAGTYRWKDARTCADSVEVLLEYPEGFLVRYNSTFGNGAHNYLKFFGTRGVLDASRWSWKDPFSISGEGTQDEGRIRPGAVIPPAESVPHMKNFFDCLRSRQEPNASIDAGYAHSVAAIMADISYQKRKEVTYDPAKRAIKS
jgi:predicted dehydrogenase